VIDCPLCKHPLSFEEDELGEGDLLICEECGASLVVTSLDPIEIQEEEEDIFDDDDDDDFDDEDDPWKTTPD